MVVVVVVGNSTGIYIIYSIYICTFLETPGYVIYRIYIYILYLYYPILIKDTCVSVVCRLSFVCVFLLLAFKLRA
jgi:hypothetical protein